VSNYLADVVMPPTEEPCPEIPEGEPPMPTPSVTDEVTDKIEEQLALGDEDDESTYEVEQAEQTEDPVPEPVRRRQKIPQDEIFTPPKVKTILDPDSLKEPEIPQKKPKQTRKKRGPATPEQLERLAKGRLKAQETRERKKKEKEERLAKEKADKELVEAVREKERKKMRKKLEEPDEDVPPSVPVKIVEKPVVVEKGFSQQDLDDAVARAVEQSVNKVETLRKQRKAVKQKEKAKAQAEAKVFQDINSALKNDVWAQCFI